MIFKSEFLKEILGKTIAGVVIREGMGAGPRYQFFLVFTDDTYMELYGDIDWSTHLEIGDVQTVKQRAARLEGSILDIT